MIAQASQFQWARGIITDFLTALGTRPAGALLATPTVVLFSGDTQPGPDSAVADFTPAAYSGYADVVPVVSAVVTVNDNALGLLAPSLFIVASADPQLTDTITGYIVTDGDEAYYGGARLDNPWPAGAAGDFLDLLVVLPLQLLVVP